MKHFRTKSKFPLLVLVILSALFGTPTVAQDKTAEVDKIFAWCRMTCEADGGAA